MGISENFKSERQQVVVVDFVHVTSADLVDITSAGFSNHAATLYTQHKHRSLDLPDFDECPEPSAQASSSLGLKPASICVTVEPIRQSGELKEKKSLSCSGSFGSRAGRAIRNYFKKWRGTGQRSLAVPDFNHLMWTFIAAFLGLGSVSLMNAVLYGRVFAFPFLMMSFGASAVLLYGVPTSPLSQPRNFVGSHVIAAFVGNTLRIIFGKATYVAAPLSVAISLLLFQLTKTVHPPGGATALIAIFTAPLPLHGYLFVFFPALTGALLMLFVAVVVNNIAVTRQYPLNWW